MVITKVSQLIISFPGHLVKIGFFPHLPVYSLLLKMFKEQTLQNFLHSQINWLPGNQPWVLIIYRFFFLGIQRF